MAILMMLAVAACSATGEAPDIPPAFDGMDASLVGCVISYGDSDYEVGPFDVGDSETVEPDIYTMFRVARTRGESPIDTMVFVFETEAAGSESRVLVDDIPPQGVVVQDSDWIDSGNPGHETTCWTGSG